MKWFTWIPGRQDTGYAKMVLGTGIWPLPFDMYLLKYGVGSEIPWHTDPVEQGRHWRLNIVLKQARIGGGFFCDDRSYKDCWDRVHLFRPDLHRHCVTRVLMGTRYVFSIGWIRK